MLEDVCLFKSPVFSYENNFEFNMYPCNQELEDARGDDITCKTAKDFNEDTTTDIAFWWTDLEIVEKYQSMEFFANDHADYHKGFELLPRFKTWRVDLPEKLNEVVTVNFRLQLNELKIVDYDGTSVTKYFQQL